MILIAIPGSTIQILGILLHLDMSLLGRGLAHIGTTHPYGLTNRERLRIHLGVIFTQCCHRDIILASNGIERLPRLNFMGHEILFALLYLALLVSHGNLHRLVYLEAIGDLGIVTLDNILRDIIRFTD